MISNSTSFQIKTRLSLGFNVKIKVKRGGIIELGNDVTIGDNADLRVYEYSKLIIEDNCKIDDGVRIIVANGQCVHLFNNTKIGYYSVLNGGGGIDIGPNTSTYGFVYIQSSEHSIAKNNLFLKNEFSHSKIEIGESVLIGPHSVILPGAKIEDGTLIAPHSIINNK